MRGAIGKGKQSLQHPWVSRNTRVVNGSEISSVPGIGVGG